MKKKLDLQFFADEVADTTSTAETTTTDVEVGEQTETTENVTPAETSNVDGNKSEKQFTQSEVNALVEKRLAREKNASSFLEKLAKRQNLDIDAFMKSVDDAIASEEVRNYSEQNNVSEEVAKKVLGLEQEVSVLKADKEKAEKDNATRKEWEDFAKEFPNIKPDDIPQEVLDMASNGSKLVDAYSRYAYKQLKASQETLKQDTIKDYLAGKIKAEPVEGSGGNAVATQKEAPKTFDEAKKQALALFRTQKDFKV
jgi:hypothetical protein